MAHINYRKSVIQQIGGGGTANSGVSNHTLGVPTDGTFDDGLLSFVPSGTTVTDAVDEINEILAALAPALGYTLDQIDGSPNFTFAGTSYSSTPKVVGSPANPLTGISYHPADTNGGSRSDFANDRVFTITTPEINTGDGNVGWRDADEGIFYFDINGSGAGIVDLGSIFNESERAAGQTITGAHASGALSITSVQPTNSFPAFQDGTAQGSFNAARIREGYNTWFMRHQGLQTLTGTMWYTPTTSPTVSNGALNAAGGGANEPNTGASYKYISGIRYYAGGTFNSVACDVNNIYGSTYGSQDLSTSSSQLTTFTENAPLPIVVSGVVTNQTHNITGKSVAYRSNIRVLKSQSVSFSFTAKNNYGGNGGSDSDSFTNVLVDTVTESPTDIYEPFDGESRRVIGSGHDGDVLFNDLSISPDWDSTESIADTAASGYNSSLQVYGGQLCYPSLDFTTITAPASNPDYSSSTGRRYYYRVFYLNPSNGRQNFTIALNGISAGSLSTVGGGGIWVEMLLPTQTKDSGGNVEWKDTLLAYTTDDAKGAREGSFPTGSSWLFTAGTKSTANSGGQVVIRISYPQGESACCSSINFTFRS